MKSGTNFQDKVCPVRKDKRNYSKKGKSKLPNGVYRIIKKIPKGKFLTYKEVAKKIGSPKAWRAVGNILNKNRDPKIPCHRVIRSDWKIGGYNKGLKRKIFLLKKEGIKFVRYGKITPRSY